VIPRPDWIVYRHICSLWHLFSGEKLLAIVRYFTLVVSFISWFGPVTTKTKIVHWGMYTQVVVCCSTCCILKGMFTSYLDPVASRIFSSRPNVWFYLPWRNIVQPHELLSIWRQIHPGS
jgi:hypothetical protein